MPRENIRACRKSCKSCVFTEKENDVWCGVSHRESGRARRFVSGAVRSVKGNSRKVNEEKLEWGDWSATATDTTTVDRKERKVAKTR